MSLTYTKYDIDSGSLRGVNQRLLTVLFVFFIGLSLFSINRALSSIHIPVSPFSNLSELTKSSSLNNEDSNKSDTDNTSRNDSNSYIYPSIPSNWNANELAALETKTQTTQDQAPLAETDVDDSLPVSADPDEGDGVQPDDPPNLPPAVDNPPDPTDGGGIGGGGSGGDVGSDTSTIVSAGGSAVSSGTA